MLLKALEVGTLAPDFSTLDDRGEEFMLSSFLTAGPALLIFYPADWGFICRNEIVEFRDRQGLFEQMGIRLVGLSTNLVVSHAVWSDNLRLKFPLLSDPPGKVAAAFGVLDTDEKSFNKGRTKRALFLVDRRSVVRYAWVTEDQWAEPDYDDVVESCRLAIAGPDPSSPRPAGRRVAPEA